MEDKFKDPKKDQSINDVDWTNFFYPLKSIFLHEKNATVISDTEVKTIDPTNLNDTNNAATFKIVDGGMIKVLRPNPYGFTEGTFISKFMLLMAVKFKNSYSSTISYIYYSVRKMNVGYIRVGVDYFKMIEKENRYGAKDKILKSWTKEAIKDDHDEYILERVLKYDDFTLVPSNTSYSPVYDNCYNLYAPFPHYEEDGDVGLDDIKHSMAIMNHIFGDQVELGMKYMKLLYESPRQILPVLVLVSSERETGKTTFLNWIHMIFGENSVNISPQELTSQFNSGYATKNIIMVDETVVEKSTSVERLKSLATAKSISVSQKFVSQYSIPFFGKIIMCTNKERDFMRIDEEEIRFWVRKINVLDGKKNTNIEIDIFNEIPKFLKYLVQIPSIDTTRSRMVFTMEEIRTTELGQIQEESKSGLRKELEILIDDWFNNNPNKNEFEATVKDIKNKWFTHNHQISMAYIRKVLKYEIEVPNSGGPKRYDPFCDNPGNPEDNRPLGRVFIFRAVDFKIDRETEVAKEVNTVAENDKKDYDDLPF